MTSHFYWLGAIPAMVFVGIFMMPYYYGSKARSVPEYLKLRFDEKTRGFNAISFAFMTVHFLRRFDARVGQADETAAGLELQFQHLRFGDHRAGLHLAGRTDLGDLQRSAAILPDRARFPAAGRLGLNDVGGWSGLVAKLNTVAAHGSGFAARHVDANRGGTWAAPEQNPMGVEWFGMVMGLGFVLSFGYWCTDFLVVQRAMAANSMSAARRTPLIAAFPKMLFPVLVILPGMIAVGNAARAFERAKIAAGAGRASACRRHRASTRPSSTETVVTGENRRLAIEARARLQHGHSHDADALFPRGLLGLGLTALMASFMSGMAGNVTAFNTVWTYDIYQSYIAPNRVRRALSLDGPACHGVRHRHQRRGRLRVSHWNNIMDLLQLVFAFVNAPLFATFMLGMFWRRATGHGAFFGLLVGHARRRGAPRPDAPARRRNLAQGRLAWLSGHPVARVPQRNGARLLDGDFRLDRLLRRDDRRLAADAAAEIGRRTAGPGLLAHAARGQGRTPALVRPAGRPWPSSCWRPRSS